MAGLKNLLCDDEHSYSRFPHLVRLIEENLFNTIYHEQFLVLFWFHAAERVFTSQGLRVFDVRGWRHARWVVADLRSTRH